MYICYTDAGYDNVSKCNGYSSFKIYDDTELVYHEVKKELDVTTSNRAEYVGMYNLLFYILNSGLESKDIKIYSDSALVVNQLNGQWAVRNAEIKKLYLMCKDLLKEIRKYVTLDIEWKSRKVMLQELGH